MTIFSLVSDHCRRWVPAGCLPLSLHPARRNKQWESKNQTWQKFRCYQTNQPKWNNCWVSVMVLETMDISCLFFFFYFYLFLLLFIFLYFLDNFNLKWKEVDFLPAKTGDVSCWRMEHPCPGGRTDTAVNLSYCAVHKRPTTGYMCRWDFETDYLDRFTVTSAWIQVTHPTFWPSSWTGVAWWRGGDKWTLLCIS